MQYFIFHPFFPFHFIHRQSSLSRTTATCQKIWGSDLVVFVLESYLAWNASHTTWYEHKDDRKIQPFFSWDRVYHCSLHDLQYFCQGVVHLNIGGPLFFYVHMLFSVSLSFPPLWAFFLNAVCHFTLSSSKGFISHASTLIKKSVLFQDETITASFFVLL